MGWYLQEDSKGPLAHFASDAKMMPRPPFSGMNGVMQNTLAGTYNLVTYGYQYKNQEKFEPISDWYSGQIHYSESGTMNVIVRFAERPEAFTDIVAYSGTYKVTGQQIHHEVTHSVRPEYVGQKLVRDFRMEKDELVTEFENTDEFIKFARWKRIC